MEPPVSLITVIEDAQKHNSCIRIAKDCNRFYAYVTGRGFTRSLWDSSVQLVEDIRATGFTGTIIVEKS